MTFTIIDAMIAAGYEALPGGREAIRQAEEREEQKESLPANQPFQLPANETEQPTEENDTYAN